MTTAEPATFWCGIRPVISSRSILMRLTCPGSSGWPSWAGGSWPAATRPRLPQTLRTALRLWRGPALNDVADLPFARAAIVRLDDRRLGAMEDRIEADLLGGQHAAVVPELEGLVAEYPLRERLCALLMNALYAGGRQADALAVYESVRRRLVDELGVDPGLQLRQIYHQILTHDPGLARLQPAGPYRGRRSNLPAPVTSFVGREAEVAQALTLLHTARLVTFTGPGGVGKTRLALQVAGRLVDTTVDGVWWVDLAPVSEPSLLADAVLSALDDQPGGQLAAPGTPPARPDDRLRTVLANRDLILVVDNCEHLADAVAHLAATDPGGFAQGAHRGHQPTVADHRRGDVVPGTATARAAGRGRSSRMSSSATPRCGCSPTVPPPRPASAARTGRRQRSRRSAEPSMVCRWRSNSPPPGPG